MSLVLLILVKTVYSPPLAGVLALIDGLSTYNLCGKLGMWLVEKYTRVHAATSDAEN
jgi:hypothetical protein